MNTPSDAIDFPRQARLAGLLYLAIILFGIGSELGVRTQLIVPDDAAATASRILASPGLFRLGLGFDVIMLLCDVLIAVVLYRLLRPLGAGLALAAMALRLVQATTIAFGLIGYYGALLLLQSGGYGIELAGGTMQAAAMLLLEMHAHAYDLGLVFFGLACVLLGLLLLRGVAYPSAIGYGLMAAGAVYWIGSFTRFLAPEAQAMVQPLYLVPLLVELGFALWLLLRAPRRLALA